MVVLSKPRMRTSATVASMDTEAISEGEFHRAVGILREELAGHAEVNPPQAMHQTAVVESADRCGDTEPSQRRRVLGSIFESLTMR